MDPAEDNQTKAHWSYPAAKAKGSTEEVYRTGLIAAKERAAGQGDTEIESAANELLQLIDEKEEGEGSEPEESGESESEEGDEEKDKPGANAVRAARDLPRLATRIFGTPLMIQGAKLEVILGVLGPRLGLDLSRAAEEGAAQPPPIARALFGAAESAAKADPTVKGILHVIDSYGGEVNGCFDLADQIFATRSAKPVYAVAADDAYSAAYALASAADKLYVSRTSGVGSIGVIALHVAQSGYDKQLGVKYTYVHAGARKADGNPHESLSRPAKASIQAEVDRVQALFAGSVAKYRGLKAEDLIKLEAATFHGENAVAAK